METYNNPFDKNKDFMLWELHEIRNELHKGGRPTKLGTTDQTGDRLIIQFETQILR